MLRTCTCIHAAHMCLCSCCRTLVFMLRVCACVHVLYVCLCSCFVRVLVFVLCTRACFHVACTCACVHVACMCACVHVMYACLCTRACVRVVYVCLCSCCGALVFMLQLGLGSRQRWWNVCVQTYMHHKKVFT